ncbi:MAG: NAD(P)H-binding protein [Bacteroidota bacterium]
MNYTITGSLGHISKPIVTKLISGGHNVTVITSSSNKTSEIEKLGAKAAVGSVNDPLFLKKAFAGSDAVYLMLPTDYSVTDLFTAQKLVADNYLNAVKANNIKHIVLLSSIGANLRKGAGPIDGLGYMEEQLEKLTEVNVKALRPSYFYYNLHAMAGLIKQSDIAGASFGSDSEKLVLTHTDDIAEVAADHLLSLNFKGFTIQHIASDERFTKDIATVLGSAVGKPNIPWIIFTDEQAKEGMANAGLGITFIEAYVQMNKALREGVLQADYWKNKPTTLGKVKLEDFAKDFAANYAKI